ncbi:hypothetical protein H0H87_010192 [Tephrocybe sp. NHM501043]|nr:hypothetical protein H0H87_010192 [Tephrocybe sp. NHM501043]
MAPGTSLGLFWALGGESFPPAGGDFLTSILAIGEKMELYRFAVDLGKLALRIAEKHGSSGEKCDVKIWGEGGDPAILVVGMCKISFL